MESTTDQPVQLHGKMEYLHRKKAVGPIAERAFSRILEDNPDFLTIEDKLLQIANENASLKSRFARILRFADVIAAAISSHAGCKHACSSCCHISVGLSGAEAQLHPRYRNATLFTRHCIPHLSRQSRRALELRNTPLPNSFLGLSHGKTGK
ncbi:hypothetical protein p1B16 (plasmid) [Aromatoleum aromaticum EbN1]|uniref:Uncharacterized protein n=1 Tax=Aromatoleum aromaticum (strain DSM 19018 / LMG 30748 / EbN1) TaxID=76114 RepID=Q5NXF2_AROAE|nr:hypothetical protein [Aromatoleum aromaticum]CAI10262.1 hypothetical protein p1B16 [Aromatoleum aromaticum EbN1]